MCRGIVTPARHCLVCGHCNLGATQALAGGEKELRETQRWLKLIQRVPLIKKPELLNDILEETEGLIKRLGISTTC